MIQIPVAREGWIFILPCIFAFILSFFIHSMIITALIGIVLIAFIVFFRDPERFSQSEMDMILSPADGKVISVGYTENNNHLHVAIFMSILNVHVNRAPFNGTVVNLKRQSGLYLPAYSKDSNKKNAQNHIEIETDWGKIKIVQIVGILARRIVCRLKLNDQLVRGERIGLIMFGSRVDIYIPNNLKSLVRAGQRVKAGLTEIACFQNTSE